MAAEEFEWTDEDFLPRNEPDPVEELREYIRRRLRQGLTQRAIEDELVEKGLDPGYAVELVSSVRRTGNSPLPEMGTQGMSIDGIPAGYFQNPVFQKRLRQDRRREHREHAAAEAAGDVVPVPPPPDVLVNPRADDYIWTPHVYYELYSPGLVAAAALLAGPAAGCVVLAANYRQMKRTGLAFLTILLGLLATCAMIWAVCTYTSAPLRLGRMQYLTAVFAAQLLGSALILWGAAWLLQGRVWRNHLVIRGKRSPFRGLVVPCLVAAGLQFFLQFVLSHPVAGQVEELQLGIGEKVQYTSGISKAQARRLGATLQEIGLFDGRESKTVVLSKEDDHFLLTVFVERRPDGIDHLPPNLDWLKELRALLKQELFPESELVIQVCDAVGRPIDRITK